MSTCEVSNTWLSKEKLDVLQNHQSNNEDELAYFVYDLDKLKSHLSFLQNQDVIKLWYAVKANPLSRIIDTISNANFGFDVASKGELSQVLNQGIEAQNILNTGPAKSKKQILNFVSKGVNTFVIESHNQLLWLQEVAKEQGVKPTVLLRVQLQWPEGEKNPLGGNSLTPFGLSLEDWQGLCISDYPNLDICGLHIFQWGNLLDNQKMLSLWSQMVPPLKSLAEKLGFTLKILDLGGGLGVDYLETGQGLDWQQTIADLAKIKQQAGVNELWLELGRFAVAECGYYVVPVVDRKENFGQQQLILAAGINHLLRPAITEQPFPVRLLRESSVEQQTFNLHGPLCTSMDELGKLQLPADTGISDQLIFGLAGAYGFTESMPFFLCHELAAEYVLTNGELVEVRRAQAASWYLR